MKTLIPMLAAVAVLISACGKSSTSPVSPIVALATSSSSGTTAVGTLAFALSATTLNTGQTISLAATGGVAPYYYCIETAYSCSQYAADMGSINNLSTSYTAPTVAGSVTLEVIDSTYTSASVTLTIGGSGAGTTTSSIPLVLTPNAGNYVEGQPITLNVTGGVPNYSFSVTGGGTFSSSTVSGNQTIFTAPSYPGTVVVQVTDSSSLVATATFNVIAASGLTITPGNGSIGTGQTLLFQVQNGVGPYQFSVNGGFGSFTNAGSTPTNSITYTAPGIPGTATINLLDKGTGKTTSTQVTVSATYSTTTITSSFQVLADQFTAITFDNVSGSAQPFFAIFGTNPSRDSNSAGTDGNGNLLCGGEVAPCVVNVSLTNFVAGTPATYRGTIEIQGRNNSVTASYCIPPANTSLAYINQNSSNLQTYGQVAFSGSNTTLFNGDLTETYFFLSDSSSGAGYGNVTFTGGYTDNVDCSDFPNHFVQVN